MQLANAMDLNGTASYSEHDVAAVPPAMVEKYFERLNGRFLFNQELRRSIIFGRHDLIADPPISRVSLLVCRNTLMYFNSETQHRILDRVRRDEVEDALQIIGRLRGGANLPVPAVSRRLQSPAREEPLQGGAGGLECGIVVAELKPDRDLV